jgi:D-alanyl-D-alanine carboxypeptidase
LNTPNGLSEIVATFGDLQSYVDDSGQLSPTWNQQYLSVAELPFSLELAWPPPVAVYKITCHRLLAQTFVDVFGAIRDAGLQTAVPVFGGCFNFRPERHSNGTKLSTHSWGIAIDLNPATNEQGTPGDMDPRVTAIFKAAGFEWGGEWVGRAQDPMHYQFATGY